MPGVTAPLPRTIGRLALVGLVLNAVIGSSVYGLPGTVAARLGGWSAAAWVVSGLGVGLVILCFAEVASRFREAGGAYLYARSAFGRLAGIEMAWLTYLVRLTAAATNANLFVIYLGEFWPAAVGPVATPLVLAGLLLPLVLTNYLGASAGLGLSSLFTVAKLLPLGAFVIAGLVLGGGVAAPAAVGGATTPAVWLEVVLMLVFAYGGFESALIPMGEARDPRRDPAIALVLGLLLCVLLYSLVQVVTSRLLPDPGAGSRPLADAARTVLGTPGAGLMAAGALVSVYGYLAGVMLLVPRLTFAMAEQRDLPAVFGAVHPRFRTPHVSVLLFGALVWLFAVTGDFLQNLTLSAASRLLTYGAVCAALVAFRRRDRTGDAALSPPWFRVPAGPAVAVAGLGFTAVLATRMQPREAAVLALALLGGLLHWSRVRRAPPAPSPATRP